MSTSISHGSLGWSRKKDEQSRSYKKKCQQIEVNIIIYPQNYTNTNMQIYRDTERNRDTKGHTEKERDTKTKMTLKHTKRKLIEEDTQINRHKVNMGTIFISLIIVTSIMPKENLLLSWMDILTFQ